GMGLTSSTAYAGLLATHRNASTPVTYTFDNFAVTGVTSTGNNPPVFAATNYSYNVSDNVATGTGVGTISASDPEGNTVTFAISAGNTNGAFAINSSTGAISVSKKLNYHTQGKYALTVRATDTGGQFSQAPVYITVTLGATISSFNSISWGTAASQPYNVNESQGEVVNGKLYTFGGFDSQKSCCTPTSRAYVFDPSANKWTSIAPMPAMNGTNYGGVTHAGFATDGTDIYFAGGYTSNATGTGQLFGTKEAWKYIVSENRYVRLPDLPIVISAGQLEYVNGKLHHIAGTNQARTLDLGNHYVLDLDNLGAGWATKAALPTPRQHAGSAVYEGKIYFIGGQTGHDSKLFTSKDVHRYDPVTNNWAQMADLPVPTGTSGRGHISSSVIVIGDRVLVLGGETVHSTGRTSMVSAYMPATNSWNNLTSLPSSRFSGIAGNLNNIIYYSGGSNSSTTFKGTPGGTTSTQQQVESFTLLNADNQQVIQNLVSGATLDLATMPTKNFNIRANTNPTTVGSVIFQLSGTESKTVNENRAPYDLMGDDGSWLPAVGNYTLKATPYSSSNGAGTAGTALTITFSVKNQTSTTSSNLVNAGGNQYQDSQGRTWASDIHFDGGLTKARSFDVLGTTDDPLYLHYRYANNGAPFSYKMPVSGSGPYTVYLHFLEPYFGAPGGKSTNATGVRVFHVDIEGQRVLSDYDIYAQDGPGKAIVKMFHDIGVTDGILNIVFTSLKDNAIISAIEIAPQINFANTLAMQIYPNPSTGVNMQVELEGFLEHETVAITLYDMTGRAVHTTNVDTDHQGTSKTEITVNRQINRGLYIIRAQTANREIRKRLLLE
ncbi:malectin domain-containing carbohydrate-binding protein, partial [Pontibacter beigongshangensis]|uniref:malectin domain-containing carbohydrate-binding protein n=1 Tax=Pontibacter beigongshangensis TaxID=2574733 RepID=UPI00164FD759